MKTNDTVMTLNISIDALLNGYENTRTQAEIHRIRATTGKDYMSNELHRSAELHAVAAGMKIAIDHLVAIRNDLCKG